MSIINYIFLISGGLFFISCKENAKPNLDSKNDKSLHAHDEIDIIKYEKWIHAILLATEEPQSAYTRYKQSLNDEESRLTEKYGNYSYVVKYALEGDKQARTILHKVHNSSDAASYDLNQEIIDIVDDYGL